MRTKYNWKNKVVIITGSSMGIGKNLAFELGRKGATIILNGRRNELLSQTTKELLEQNIKSSAIPGDVSKFQDCIDLVEAVKKKYNKIDVLINNAGIATFSPFEKTNPKIFQKVIDVNLIGCINMT